MIKALSFDVGGTKIFSAIVNQNGEIISDVEKNDTPKSVEEIENLFKKIIEKHEQNVDVIAFSTAGAVNRENNKVVSSTGNLAQGYRNIQFDKLSQKLVYVENDANCAAWAEYKIGASKGCDNSIVLTLGTGVGGGIIIDGALLKGKNGAAGEMHFKISQDKKRLCTCESHDCFEIYASGNGLRLSGVEIMGQKDITTYDIIDGVKNGNTKAIEALKDWQNNIVLGLISLTNIFDPDCIVLSGSMGEFCDVEDMQKRTNSEIVTTPTKILHAKTKNHAGLIGAGLLACNKANQI